MPVSNPKPESQRFIELPESVFWGVLQEHPFPVLADPLAAMNEGAVPEVNGIVTESVAASRLTFGEVDGTKPRFRRAIAGIEALRRSETEQPSSEFPVEAPVIPTPRLKAGPPHPVETQLAEQPITATTTGVVAVIDKEMLSEVGTEISSDNGSDRNTIETEAGGRGYKTHHLVLGGAALALVAGGLSYNHYNGQQTATEVIAAQPNSTGLPGQPTHKPTPTASHKATALPIPKALLDCQRPLLEFQTSTTASVNVPVHQLDGTVASFQFSDTKLAPRAQLLTKVAIAACNTRGANAIVGNGKTEMVSRAAISITPLFARVTPGSTTTMESVQRFQANSTGLTASPKVSATEAAMVNSWLLANGSQAVAYGQTVDIEMHAAAADELSTTNAALIEQTTDAAVRAQLEAFAKQYGITGLSIVFSGNYPSAAANYQQLTKDFQRLPISLFNTQTNHPIFGSSRLTAKGATP